MRDTVLEINFNEHRVIFRKHILNEKLVNPEGVVRDRVFKEKNTKYFFHYNKDKLLEEISCFILQEIQNHLLDKKDVAGFELAKKKIEKECLLLRKIFELDMDSFEDFKELG